MPMFAIEITCPTHSVIIMIIDIDFNIQFVYTLQTCKSVFNLVHGTVNVGTPIPIIMCFRHNIH